MKGYLVSGIVLCSLLLVTGAPMCGPGEVCEYNGETYDVGETFPAGDGCNTCTCMEGGEVACTEIACPDPQMLCEATGGRWDEQSCGHYECGFPPPCDAIIPGCDCGPGKNFDPLEGCIFDEACACSDTTPDCPGGSLCCCPDGGIDGCRGAGTCVDAETGCL